MSAGHDDSAGTRSGAPADRLSRGSLGAQGLSFGDAINRLRESLQFGIHPSLDGIRALCAALGDPQDSYVCVQVAGTNGKTSVARMTAAVLRAHGLHVGLYTSPHLVSYTERMEIDGVPVSEEHFANALDRAFGAADLLRHHATEALGVSTGDVDGSFTEFELLTAAALWLFEDANVDWAVLEVGMGGRWDATSVVSPEVSVVTGIALDHTERLGTTREEIAADKAHVIKAGSRAVLGPGCAGVEHVFLDRALAVGAATVRVGQGEHDVAWEVRARPEQPGGITRLDVIGAVGHYPGLDLHAPSYQAPNLATAIATAEVALRRALDPTAVRMAVGRLSFPGRFELLRAVPPLVIDGAHNPQAAGVLAEAISEAFGSRHPAIVIGVLEDKDAAGIVRALEPVAGRFVCTQPDSSRARPAAALAETVCEVTGTRPDAVATVRSALNAVAGEAAVVTGSLYTAGEARGLVLG